MVLVDAAAAMELGPGSMLRSRRSMAVDVAEQLVDLWNQRGRRELFNFDFIISGVVR